MIHQCWEREGQHSGVWSGCDPVLHDFYVPAMKGIVGRFEGVAYQTL
jgi:hypothetical protein